MPPQGNQNLAGPGPEGIRPVEVEGQPVLQTPEQVKSAPETKLPNQPTRAEVQAPETLPTTEAQPVIPPTQEAQPVTPHPESLVQTVAAAEKKIDKTVTASLPKEAEMIYSMEGADPADLTDRIEQMRLENLEKAGFKADKSD